MRKEDCKYLESTSTLGGHFGESKPIMFLEYFEIPSVYRESGQYELLRVRQV